MFSSNKDIQENSVIIFSHLCMYLQSCNFSCFSLGGNKLGDEGAEYIIEAVTKNESQSIISIR